MKSVFFMMGLLVSQMASATVDLKDVKVADAWNIYCRQAYAGKLSTDSPLTTYAKAGKNLGITAAIGYEAESRLNADVVSVSTASGGGNDTLMYAANVTSGSGSLFAGAKKLVVVVDLRNEFGNSDAYKASIYVADAKGNEKQLNLEMPLYCELAPRS